jgi:DNA-binding MarR family transcriptional regulator
MRTISRFSVGPGRSAKGHPAAGRRLACGLLEAAEEVTRMNAHFFATKRAHYGVLRVLRKPLKSFGLTAARYDLMHALFGNRGQASPGYNLKQSYIRRQLGVCKSVVSRMLKSLEELGLVERWRCYGDRRQRWVKLTERGMECMRRTLQCLERAAGRLLRMAICFGHERDKDECFEHMVYLESYLRGMRTHYGDTARLFYPWHPDD